jgi:hypothetical protein
VENKSPQIPGTQKTQKVDKSSLKLKLSPKGPKDSSNSRIAPLSDEHRYSRDKSANRMDSIEFTKSRTVDNIGYQ